MENGRFFWVLGPLDGSGWWTAATPPSDSGLDGGFWAWFDFFNGFIRTVRREIRDFRFFFCVSCKSVTKIVFRGLCFWANKHSV